MEKIRRADGGSRSGSAGDLLRRPAHASSTASLFSTRRASNRWGRSARSSFRKTADALLIVTPSWDQARAERCASVRPGDRQRRLLGGLRRGWCGSVACRQNKVGVIGLRAVVAILARIHRAPSLRRRRCLSTGTLDEVAKVRDELELSLQSQAARSRRARVRTHAEGGQARHDRVRTRGRGGSFHEVPRRRRQLSVDVGLAAQPRRAAAGRPST